MKAKISFTVIFFVIVQLLYSQEEKYSADKFVAKCPNQIFIGAILETNGINQDLHSILDVAINPIAISYTFPAKSRVITPTYDNMMDILHGVLKSSDILKSNYSFNFAVKRINSYEELAINWGQRINPQSLLGVSSNHKPNKNIVLIDISQSFFSIAMDLPQSLSTDSKVLQRLDELIYVNSIQFGRKVTVLIESNIDYYELKETVNYLLNKNPIDKTSQSILANSTIRIITSGNNKIKDINPDNPFTSILNYFSQKVTPEDFGLPISFSASNMKDNSVFVNQFTL